MCVYLTTELGRHVLDDRLYTFGFGDARVQQIATLVDNLPAYRFSCFHFQKSSNDSVKHFISSKDFPPSKSGPTVSGIVLSWRVQRRQIQSDVFSQPWLKYWYNFQLIVCTE